MEKICEPVLPEYIDDSNGLKLAECAFAGSKLDPEQQKMVQEEIAGLVTISLGF